MKVPRALAGLREALREERRLLLDTVLLGVVGAFGARLFVLLVGVVQQLFLVDLAGYRPPRLASERGAALASTGLHGLWLIPLATTLGGLLSGLLVYGFAPEAEGHGTDTAVAAFHRRGGFIRARVPPLKLIASAITIGSGGSAGREGPTALISAGIGSVYATWTKRSDDDRRLLTLVGMAAGLSAVFRSPIGTALFAVEVLYGGMAFEGGALLYTMLGSIVAYAVNGLFVGWGSLFRVPENLPAPNLAHGLVFLLLGVLAGLVGTLLPVVFYGLRDLFRRLPLPNAVKPAIGGLGVGLLALMAPQVLGGGYAWMQAAIDGRVALELLGILVFAKLLAFALTVSSGGSGGVFAPSLFVGAMLGGLLAGVFHLSTPALVVVGMAAVFGAAARVPIATVLMVTEMTGGYHLLVPAATAVMIAFLIQSGLTRRFKYRSLYEAQVFGPSDSPAHSVDYVEAAFRLLRERRVSVPKSFPHVDVRSLFASGLSLDLPEGRQLLLRTVLPRSRHIGRSLASLAGAQAPGDLEVVAVFRQEHTLLPHGDLLLREGDRVLILAAPAARARVEALFPQSPKSSQ
jgi:chloride channel protein, CIC family